MVNFSSKIIIRLAVLIVCVGLATAYFIVLPRRSSDELVRTSVSSSVSINPIQPSFTPLATQQKPKPRATTSTSPIPRRTPLFYLPTSVPRSQITAPATCQISGSINFINDNLYESKGAKIVYQNVDDPNRFIFWKISPDDGALKAGPNIFQELNLPNNEREVGVTLVQKATAKSYLLTATITYGVPHPDWMEIKNANCSGTIAVNMP